MDRAKFARVDTLTSALSCPLCFEIVEDCVVTPCGHSFCRKCAGDAITRKHCCPVCQVGVIGGEAGLIRNFLVDEVTGALHKATEDTDVGYMRLLLGAATGTNGHLRPNPPSSRPLVPPQPPRPPEDAGATLTTSGHPRPLPDLSPVEAILVKRMRDAFLGYQSYYDRERAAHESEIRGLEGQLLAAKREDMDVPGASDVVVARAEVPGVAATPAAEKRARKVAALEGAIEDSRARFKAGMEALLQDFDEHAKNATPPPSLLPSTVTVILASRGVRFNTKVLPTDFPENLYDKVRAYYLASGDEVRGFGPNTRLSLRPLSSTAVPGGGGGSSDNGSGAAAAAPATAQGQAPRQQAQTHHHPIGEATQTIFSQSPGGRIGAGWALVVDGAVLLQSEEVKPCFAVEFVQQQQQREGGANGLAEGSGQQRVDYFRCGECNLNWLCAACATHCHSQCRDVKPFMLNHMPTWACCYCSKKRSRIGCKLGATGGKAERAKT